MVEQLFAEMGLRPGQVQVECCTGYVLSGVRAWLSEQGYDWRTAKITGPLQEKVERAFLDLLQGYGLDIDYETLTEKQGLAFWLCLR